jgi:hypothetical protein
MLRASDTFTIGVKPESNPAKNGVGSMPLLKKKEEFTENSEKIEIFDTAHWIYKCVPHNYSASSTITGV